MNKLLKEAIADAKAVRETALANAKLALEEAFTPRLQSMLSAKLSEEEGMEDEPVAEDEEMMPMDEPAAEEVPVEEPAMDEPVAENEGEYGEEEVTEDEEMMAAPAPEEAPVEEPVAEEEEDLELEAILRELEGEEEEVTEDEDEEVTEQSNSTGVGTGDNKMKPATAKDEEDPGKGKLSETEGDEEETVAEGEGEDVDLEEIINALREEEGDEEAAPVEENDTAGVDDGDAAKDLEEAYKVIRFMKSKLNEVNLLNAKLLFSNKLFRNHSLNESQKMKVIENFDRAQTLREVKLVFATLSESFRLNGGKKRKTIKESYASKASRSTRPSRRVISEGSTVANRFKKLAGLI